MLFKNIENGKGNMWPPWGIPEEIGSISEKTP